ncbi:MAG: GNAT family N-acetyltransferase [Acidimicrobiales bacterium]
MTAGRGSAPAGGPRRAAPATRRRLLVAMTVAGDAAREIDGLRRALGGSGLGRIDPHVTLVPPVNVREEDLVDVLRLVRGVAAADPAEVVLGPARTFAPRTPVVYLEVGGDTARIADLRRRLSQPPLVPGVARPERPFVPHVTIGGRVDRARIAGALAMLDEFKLPVSLATVVLCEQDVAAPRHPWHVIADVALGSGATVGRGGRELVFVGSTILDPETAEWAQATPGEEPPGPEKDEAAGARFVLVAYAGGRPVGAVVGSVAGATVEVHRIRLDAGRRGEGIGGQLVAAAERAAAGRGCTRVVFAATADGPVERFLAHRGYVREAVFAGDSRDPRVTLGRSVR